VQVVSIFPELLRDAGYYTAQAGKWHLGEYARRGLITPPYLADTEETKQDLAKYYDEITRFDDHIGKVEAELKAQGVLNNTMIIIMSDNCRNLCLRSAARHCLERC
jgi:arylsulfatase A-like enzyme